MMRIELNDKVLENVYAGVDYPVYMQTYSPCVNSGYLALRNDIGYDSSNEIGCLWPGSSMTVIGDPIGDYVLVEVNSTASGPWGSNVDGRVGYVNYRYLQ